MIEEFNTQSVPVLKRSCISDFGELNSFRLVMKGLDERSNILSDSAGPSEKGRCSNKRAPEDHPIKGSIWYDDQRV